MSETEIKEEVIIPRDDEEVIKINRINCLANVLKSIKDIFIKDRDTKDKIANKASELLLDELEDFNAKHK
jgi:hypothetical protein